MIGRILTTEQNEFINMYIQGRSITEISNITGKSRTTIYKWLEWPEIQEEMNRRKEEMKKAAKAKIVGQINGCVDIMLDLAHNSKDARTKFAAAKYLLDQGIGAPTTNQIPTEEINKPKKEIDIDAMLEKINRKK